MGTACGFKRLGVDIATDWVDGISSTAADTGYKTAGVDLVDNYEECGITNSCPPATARDCDTVSGYTGLSFMFWVGTCS